MIVADTSGILALLDRDARIHARAASFVETTSEPLLVTPFVLAELDYLVAERFGLDTELAVLSDVSAGAYELVTFSADDVNEAADVIRRYRDLRIGLADASIVVVAERYATDRVLTLDERHFRALKSKRGAPFVVLPADA